VKANKLAVVISAPSGSGKSTLIRRLLEVDKRFSFSISVTTRKPREGEIDGLQYKFVAESEFKESIARGEFVEWAVVHGNYYGTPKKEIDRIQRGGNIPVFDVDVQGARSLKSSLEGAVYIIIVPPSLRELEARLRKRKSDTEEQIRMRLKNAIGELREYRMYDYIVVNDRIDVALEQIQAIVTAELCRRERAFDVIESMFSEGGCT